MLHDTWVIIDEISLVPIDMLGQIARWASVGAKFVMFGDFDGQFEAWQDRWSQVSYSDVPNSQLLVTLCKHIRFHMEFSQRIRLALLQGLEVDQPFFDWFTGLYKESDDDIPRLVSETRNRYPVRVTPMEVTTVLCLSHHKREIVNARQNTAFAAVQEASGKHILHLEWSGEALKGTACQPQNMAIWEGIHLIAYPRGSGKNSTGVVQGVCYSVERITDDAVTIKMLDEYCPKQATPNAEHEHADAPVDVSKAKVVV